MINSWHMLIGLELLCEIVETVFWTGALRDGIPLSAFLIGQSGSGKSRVLIQYTGESIHRSDDLTSSGLMEILERDKDSKLKHILISDLNAILSHKASTTNLTIGNLLSLMSEGIVRIDDGRRQKEVPHKPVGLVVAVTEGMYETNFFRWDITGFRRRFLPIFFNYKSMTIQRIQQAIESSQVRMVPEKKRHIKIPERTMQPVWTNEARNLLSPLSYKFAENLAWKPTVHFTEKRARVIFSAPGKVPLPMAPEQMIQELAEAYACKNGSGKVELKHMEFAASVIDFTKYGQPQML